MGLTHLKKLLGIYFDPSVAPPAWDKPIPKPAREKPTKPDNLHHVAGRTFKVEGLEWTLADTGAIENRSPELTEQDLYQINLSQDSANPLNEKKARVIKPLWAKGMANSEIEKTLSEQFSRGYSLSTVERYSAAFGKAMQLVPAEICG